MDAVVIDIRDLLAVCKRFNYPVNNLAWSFSRYIGDRYAVPTVTAYAGLSNCPVPRNLPPDDILGRYVDGNLTTLLNSECQDVAISVDIDDDYLILKR